MFDRARIRPPKARDSVMQDATVREFSGGWNVVDNDLNLSTKFATVLDNMSREEDGSMGVRWGTMLIKDVCLAVSAPADVYNVNVFYFQNSTITVMSDGRIARTLADGTTTVVWSTAIAGGLVGAPAGWGSTDFASFAVYNGKLLVCNGSDKPLIIDFTNTPPVQYLADEASGSNGNVPICRYVIAMNHFVVMAGDPLYPDRVHISNHDTSGTWFGDASPNDGTYVDLGKVGVQGEQVITGLNRYRDQIVVGFRSASVLGKLGIYNDATPPAHTPNFDDVVEGFGCHSHRTMVNLGNDLFLLDDVGITSIARSLYSATTEPKRVSELIDPEINANVNRLRDSDVLLGAHAVYNSNDKQYMCFIPNFAPTPRPLQTDAFEIVQEANTDLWVHIADHGMGPGDQFSISGATDWNTVDADTVLNGKVHTVERVINEHIVVIVPTPAIDTDPSGTIMGGGSAATWTPQWTETIGYVYTFINELKIKAWARYRGWRWRASCRTELGNVVFADDRKLFMYGNQNLPLYQDYVGTSDERDIAFAWEMPWADFDKRVHTKHVRYVQLDTRGSAHFTMMMFVDLIYQMGGVLIPNTVRQFIAGDSGGYGNGVQPYGGGRRTSDQRLYEWPARGKLFKLRFEGIVNKPLRIVAVSLLYQNGSIRR